MEGNPGNVHPSYPGVCRHGQQRDLVPNEGKVRIDTVSCPLTSTCACVMCVSSSEAFGGAKDLGMLSMVSRFLLVW